MNGLDDMGVDILHAGEVFATLKAIGPEQLEINFGVGRKEKAAMRGREPLRPTDIVKTLQEKHRRIFSAVGNIDRKLDGMKVVIGSTDIHDYGKEMIKAMCNTAGATVFDLGTYITPNEIIENLLETESKVVIICTYNGIALSFTKEVVELLRKAEMQTQLILGGLINENQDGGGLAVDVSEQVKSMGVNVDNSMESIIPAIRNTYLETEK